MERVFYLHFGEFEAFEVFFFEYCPGFVLVLFYYLLFLNSKFETNSNTTGTGDAVFCSEVGEFHFKLKDYHESTKVRKYERK